MRLRHVCGIAAVMAGLFGACTVASAGTFGVNGIADQHADTLTSPALAGLPRVTRARLIVSWDVATRPASDAELVQVGQWLAAAASRRLEPMIAFAAAYNSPTYASTYLPPSATTYRSAVHAFRVRFPDVTVFTPWNEPNHPRNFGGQPQTTAADAAAHYYNQLASECQQPSSTARTCQVAAGDFSDTEEPSSSIGLNNFLAAYQRQLTSIPTRWAIHVYHAVEVHDDTQFSHFLTNIGTGGLVWLTEAGAFHCFHGVPRTDAEQNTHAHYIFHLAHLQDRISRIYYYYLSPGSATCDSDTFDTALTDPLGNPRLIYATIRDET